MPTIPSSWDLSSDLYELWEERVAIMHFDAGLPWADAEREAMVDVLRGLSPEQRALEVATN